MRTINDADVKAIREDMTATQRRLLRLAVRHGRIEVLPGHRGNVGGRTFADETLCWLLLNDLIEVDPTTQGGSPRDGGYSYVPTAFGRAAEGVTL